MIARPKETARGWMALLLAGVVLAALYLLNVMPGLGPGRKTPDEKKGRDDHANLAIEPERPRAALTDEAVLALLRDPAALAAGRQTFTSTCAPCHRPDGGGNIGPNLADDYWLLGNKPLEVAHTITVGVPDRGMPTWGQTLSPKQVGRVTAFVLSLHGTNPPNPKGPQGVKLEETAPARRLH